MGVETRIDVVIGYGTTNNFADTIATIQMSGCDSDFENLFDKKDRKFEFGLDTRCVGKDKEEGIDGDFYSLAYPEKTDPYGAVYTYTDNYKKVANWLERKAAECFLNGENFYRRYKILLGILDALDQNDWGDDRTIYLVHSNY